MIDDAVRRYALAYMRQLPGFAAWRRGRSGEEQLTGLLILQHFYRLADKNGATVEDCCTAVPWDWMEPLLAYGESIEALDQEIRARCAAREHE